jgi:hypothetical protein
LAQLFAHADRQFNFIHEPSLYWSSKPVKERSIKDEPYKASDKEDFSTSNPIAALIHGAGATFVDDVSGYNDKK